MFPRSPWRDDQRPTTRSGTGDSEPPAGPHSGGASALLRPSVRSATAGWPRRSDCPSSGSRRSLPAPSGSASRPWRASRRRCGRVRSSFCSGPASSRWRSTPSASIRSIFFPTGRSGTMPGSTCARSTRVTGARGGYDQAQPRARGPGGGRSARSPREDRDRTCLPSSSRGSADGWDTLTGKAKDRPHDARY